MNKARTQEIFLKSILIERALIELIKSNENVLTASSSKSRSGEYHDYYHCNSCKNVRIPANEVCTTVETIMDEITISRPAKKLYDVMVRKIHSTEQPTRKRSDDTILKEINLNKERIIRLQDNYADGHIDTQTFQETSNRYKQQLQLLEKEKRDINANESTYQKHLKNGIDLLTDIKRYYSEGDYSVKHAILGSIFPEKLFFEKTNCRTTGLNEALRLILNTSKIQRKKKRTILQ